MEDKFQKQIEEIKAIEADNLGENNGFLDSEIVDILFKDYPKIFDEILTHLEKDN